MRIFYTLLFVCITSFAFSQAHVYKFTLHGIDDGNDLKNVNQSITKIFDVSPEYNPYTEYFIVKSDVNINYETFAGKMAALGYDVNFFLKDTEGIVPEIKKEED